jgi:dephospho-CoA kinase
VKKIAITGSYASGKTYVLDYISNLGYKVFSCDIYVKNLYKNPQIQNKLLELLGNLQKFDINEIKNIIYRNDDVRYRIEKFIHPLVIEGFNEFCLSCKNEYIIFAEVPLLFEAKLENNFSYVITSFCSEETRMKRAQTRDFWNLELYNKIQEIQYTQFQKIILSRYNINTDRNVNEIQEDIIQLIKRL